MLKICEQCGEAFRVKPSRANTARFCSRKCMGLCYSEDRIGENNPRWKGGNVKLNCEICSKEFETIPSRVSMVKCCSKECRYLRHSEIMRGWSGPWKKKIQKICKWCGQEFSVKPSHANRRVFCSVACMGLWNSKNRRGENHQSWQGGKARLNCKVCGIEFEAPPSANRKVCSMKCVGLLMSETRRGENHWNWQGGLSLEAYGRDFDDKLKQAIRKRDNHTCAICNEVWRVGQDKFHVHHINYKKTDNRPENLITLCRDCHIKTNHNRQYWENRLSPVTIENPQMTFPTPIAATRGGIYGG